MVEFIGSSWLEENLNDPHIAKVDPRPIVKYLGGHIPNSVNLPLTKLLHKETLALLPPEHLTKIFGEAGISRDTTSVVYDSYDGQNAAMVAWVLEYLGNPNVKIFSRRMEGWVSDGREVLYKPVVSQRKEFDAKPDKALRATSEELLQKGSTKILDLRSREEFQGKVATEIRTGHIPGAINLPWTDLIGDTREFLKPVQELGRIVEKIARSSSDVIVTYCSFGPRAAIGYLALQQLGYNNVKVYDGSFHQWAQHAELPVEGEGLQLQL